MLSLEIELGICNGVVDDSRKYMKLSYPKIYFHWLRLLLDDLNGISCVTGSEEVASAISLAFVQKVFV